MTIQDLKEFCKKYPNSFEKRIKDNADLLSWVLFQSKKYNNDESISLKEHIISVLHALPVICAKGNKLKIKSIDKGFRFCNTPSKCYCHRQNKITKSKENYLKTLNPDKIKKTMLAKYGVDHNWKIEAIKNKRKQHWKSTLGVDNPLKSDKVKKQISETNIKRYGVDNPWKSKDVREKITNTIINKYNRNNPSQIHIEKEVLEKTHNPEWLRSQHHDNRIPIYSIADQLGINASGLQSRFHQYGIDIKRYPQSQMEQNIIDFLKSLNPDLKIITNSRDVIHPLELDIYLPEKNLAIEYCGLYWHTEKSGNRLINYHEYKLNLCLQRGIRLITIFSDEWEQKRDIVMCRIKHILGFNEKICFARQTDVFPISSKSYKTFVDQHHIQGAVAAKIKLGAFYNDQLVAVMGLGTRRRNLGAKNVGSDEYEMLRFCTSGNIPGVGSKLFSYFVKNYQPKLVVSYADRRWGEGDFYKNLGFEFVKSTGPSYFYTNDYKKRHNRFAFRKDVIVREMNGDSNLTEWQNMQAMGYDRIWDCGTNKYIYSFF